VSNLRPDISVVICAFTERRWTDLTRAIESVAGQTLAAHQVVLVIDHNDALLRRATAAWPNVLVVPNREQQGLSGARNTGASEATGSIVAFLDDDATAEPQWLELLAAGYRDAGVLAVGGAVEPTWPRQRPPWFPPEFDWVVGCTHSGMPRTPRPVRNLVGANMSIRRDVLLELGGFHHGIGRVGATPVGCEETELCIRAQQRRGGTVLYVPRARVRHRVGPERTTIRYFLSRCLAEGTSKALISRLVGARDGLGAERTYVRVTLTTGIARDLFGAERWGIARSAVMAAGLVATGWGYVSERLSTRLAAH
jgi:GT2 family glycosyltransferase